jgi:hypothetical protein
VGDQPPAAASSTMDEPVKHRQEVFLGTEIVSLFQENEPGALFPSATRSGRFARGQDRPGNFTAGVAKVRGQAPLPLMKVQEQRPPRCGCWPPAQ